MKCVFTGKETMNKYNNQPMCKSVIAEARKRRDEHNAKLKERVGAEAYYNTNTLQRYEPNNFLEDQFRVTAGYCLNKMYQEQNKEEEKKSDSLIGDSDAEVQG